jgi:hypothetical protein
VESRLAGRWTQHIGRSQIQRSGSHQSGVPGFNLSISLFRGRFIPVFFVSFFGALDGNFLLVGKVIWAGHWCQLPYAISANVQVSHRFINILDVEHIIIIITKP